MIPRIFRNDFTPLLKLVLPLALTGLIQSSIYFFETMFLAHVNQESLAAGALVGWLYGTFAVILFGTLGSINIIISQKHGGNDTKGIIQVLRDGIILSILISLLAFIFFRNMAPIFLVFGQQASTVMLAQHYLHALSWGLLPNFILIAIFEAIIGIGHAKTVMTFTIISVSLNIFFSYLFIFGKFGVAPLGVAGAGWGITVSYTITTFILIAFMLLSKTYRDYFRPVFTLGKPKYIGELLQIGLPMGLMYCFEVAFFFAITLIMGAISNQMLAANQIALQYLGTLMAVIFATAQAITVRMGHLIGAKQISSAEQAAYSGILISIIFMSIVAIIYWIFPSLLISVDFNIHDSQNAAIVADIKQLLKISAVFQLLEAIRISFFGALRALKDTHFTLFVSIISFWCLSLPIGYILAKYLNFGGSGLWFGMIIGASVSVILLRNRFKVKMHRIKSRTH